MACWDVLINSVDGGYVKSMCMAVFINNCVQFVSLREYLFIHWIYRRLLGKNSGMAAGSDNCYYFFAKSIFFSPLFFLNLPIVELWRPPAETLG